MAKFSVREMLINDCTLISSAFHVQGWNKPRSLYQKYYQEHVTGQRTVLVAECDGAFSGYVTIVWVSDYEPFRSEGIPEIVDLNVLIPFQRQGVASALMSNAEGMIAEKSQRSGSLSSGSQYAGIGVGLTAEYGAAQIMYIKRGYVPNGTGIHYEAAPLRLGDRVTVDHSLALYLIKALAP